MNYNEALQFIHSNFWQGSKPGLERTKELLDLMGNPQENLQFIHVAGTNGKGSFCAMLTSILIEAGEKVGTYTSPYVMRFNERMKINGKDIPDDALSKLCEYIRPFTERMQEKPTEFELITAIAMEYFRREGCTVVVLECGMGGRLDSTNIIKKPILSVITGIAMDHTAFLGDTIEKIAAEKAGIIKENCPVLYCGNSDGALDVIKERAAALKAPFFQVDRRGLAIHSFNLDGTVFDWKNWNQIHIPLLGMYQVQNAQNALCAISILNDFGILIDEKSAKIGLRKTKWPARFEILSRDPIILFDGGHNPEGVSASVESAKRYFPDQKLLILTGVLADKDYRFMAEKIAEIAKEAFCITPENPRALSAEDYAKVFRALGVSAAAYENTGKALLSAIKKAKKEGTPLLCLGSLYMYAEIRSALDEI